MREFIIIFRDAALKLLDADEFQASELTPPSALHGIVRGRVDYWCDKHQRGEEIIHWVFCVKLSEGIK